MSDRFDAPLHIPTSDESVYLAEPLPGELTAIIDALPYEVDDLPEGGTAFAQEAQLLNIVDSDTRVGSVLLGAVPGESDGDIGFWVKPEFRGCGYATTAVRALTGYASQRLSKLHAIIPEGNPAAAGVLGHVGYEHVSAGDGFEFYEYSGEGRPRRTVGVLKHRATRGSMGGRTDSAIFDDDPAALNRMIRKFAGPKNPGLQDAITEAIGQLSRVPDGIASEKLEAFGDSEPTIGSSRVSMKRMKPSELPDFGYKSALRDIRIVFGVFEDEHNGQLLGILEILHRDDFGKKYN
ncbi:MAG TPA: GNAT family N-acetyltransferase [Candidatus Saccharimonadales bacterium]|jgi:RimJ/RimL family protein N-acetyltransferase